MYTDEHIFVELESTISALDAMAANIVASMPPFLSDPYSLRDRNGMPALGPIVIARAQAFAAYTALKIERMTVERLEKEQRDAEARITAVTREFNQGII